MFSIKSRADRPWTEQGYADFHGAAWYAVCAHVPAFEPERRVYLYFGAVNGVCRVWVDGVLAGERWIPPAYVWRLPFALDVTGLIGPATQHRITVQVRKEDGEAGMWRPVELRLGQ